jgi:serine/threonine-protein kinase
VSQAIQPEVHRYAIRQQLEKILAHGLFARSERMGRFLRLAVERALEGRADELKEYLVGVEVFDRKPSYDPRVDPIVRVEARRLRSKLKSYYEGDGRNDPVVIEFVAGSYAPRIRAAAPSETSEPPSAATATSPASVAVLPFVNLSPQPENEYFSDGLTEELIHALTKLPGMRVVAWTTAARMRGRERDILAIRRDLDVANVLTGSVRIGEKSLRVRAQLIDTATGVYLWSETFDRPREDIFAIQEEIARAIVRTLDMKLAAGREPAPAPRARGSLSAYDWYLKGRYFWHRRTPGDMARSIECFENALAADSESALAYTGLADAYSLMVDYGLLPPWESMPKAEAMARRAIALDPELAEAHVSLAFIQGLHAWSWEESLTLYRRAIELNPGYATAHHWLGIDLFATLGRFDEARQEIEIAVQLDPLSNIILENAAYLHMLERNYDAAIEADRRILKTDPSFYKSYTSMGRIYSLAGDHAKALEMLHKGRELAGDVPNILSAMGHVHGVAGDHESARAMLAELTARAQHGYVPMTCFALVHLGLGEKDRALDCLEQACGRRDLPVVIIKVHPVYDALRGEPRFDALLKRIGLE